MKKFSLMIIVILASLILNTFTYGEVVIDLEHIAREEGIGNQSVSGMIQDRYGFIWFATQGGLYRYDGRTFETFRNDPFNSNTLIHNLIQTIYYDMDLNEIWLGTYQGVSRFNIDENQFTNYGPENYDFLDPVIVAINKDDKGNIWIGSMSGLSKFNTLTDEIIHYDIPQKTVRSICNASNGNLYIGTYNGLYYIEDDQLKQYDIDLPSPYVMDVKEYEPGLLTLGLYEGGIIEIDLQQHVSYQFDIDDNRVYSHLKDHKGNLWIGSWGGGLYKDGKTLEKVIDPDFEMLAEDIIYQIFQDESDIIWILTNGDGIYKYNDMKKSYLDFSSEDHIRPLLSGRINHLYEDSDQNIWMSVYGQGINVYNQKKDELYAYTSEDGLNKLTTSVIELDSKLIVASGNQLLSFDSETQSFSEFYTMDINLIYSLELENENIWIGTYNDGLYKLDTISMTLETIMDDQLSINETIYDILMDREERLWVATSKGILLIENNQKTMIVQDKNRENTIGSNIINSIHEDRQGNIWFATSGGGLAKWVIDDQFINYTEVNGLSSNEVIGILEDTYGRIWVSTDNGISMVDPLSGEIVIYTPDDGIGAWEFSRGTLNSSDGRMLFGSIIGVTSLPAALETEYSHSPRLYITNVSLNDDPIKNILFYNDETVKFESSSSSLSLDFTALDYEAPGKILYNYRLKGFTEAWTRAGHISFAKYDRLPPGNYIFEVYAETSKKLTSEKISVKIIVTAPWYRTIYAYIMYGLIFIVFIIIIFKLKEGSAVKQKNSELNRLNGKLESANKELESISLKDALTGLFNRRYFNLEFLDELHLASRSQNNLTLMMLDIDDFKHYNDTYGHIVGDQLLIDLGKYLSQVLPRKTDFIARIGGDEFAIVLYDTDATGAEIIAKRLLDAVNEVVVESDDGIVTEHVNVSIGVYSFKPNEDVTVNNSLKLADQALYQAKFQGKNQYFIYKDH